MTFATIAAVHDHLELIASKPGKLDKTELVQNGMASPLFARVIKAALDPFITYGIAQLPEPSLSADQAVATLDDESWWQVLSDLASRKLSGNAARDAVLSAANLLEPRSWSVFKRIVTSDLRAGFSEETVNKVAPGTFASFPYMRCSLPAKSNIADPTFWANGAYSQEKADGRFANVNHDHTGAVWITSRQGTPMPLDMLGDLVAQIRATLSKGAQSHGELVVYQDGKLLPRQEGNGVITHIDNGGRLAEGQQLVFLAWDQIPLSAVKAKGKHDVKYRDRLASLLYQIAGSPQGGRPGALVRLIPTRPVANKDEAMAHYRELLAEGKEGTIVKTGAATWKDGTSKDQVKFKLEVPVELRVKGFNEGTGKFEGQLGSLRCESECGRLRVDVSGRGDAMRAEVWANKDSWLDAVVTVKSNGVILARDAEHHSLFLPIFVERRTDKSAADTLEQINEQFTAAVGK